MLRQPIPHFSGQQTLEIKIKRVSQDDNVVLETKKPSYFSIRGVINSVARFGYITIKYTGEELKLEQLEAQDPF